MYSTGYAGLTTMQKGLPFEGGFCKWWYTPREHIAAWPTIDPVTQYLSGEPTLAIGKVWYGPVYVPNTQIGFEEPIKRNAAGLFYNQKLSGYQPGDDPAARITRSNMPYHQYVVIGQQRAGGFFLVLGNQQSGLRFDPDFTTGPGIAKPAGNSYTLTKQSLYPALPLLTFSQSPLEPPPIIETNTNNVEIITFNTELEKTFEWTALRLSKFGQFPTIQVWQTGDVTEPIIITVPINVDAAPPSNTLFTVYTPGTPGFIVIK